MAPDRPRMLLAAAVSLALVTRWSCGLGPYSGAGRPPMFGDFEAQRHWMEVTLHLPLDQWYRNTSENDLQYWGLDYPPLTAYHSYLMGAVADSVNASWVSLTDSSRGVESARLKVLMRATVYVGDAVLMPALVYYAWAARGQAKCHWVAVAFAMLQYPALILVDHGHFQYNGVSLGLFAWALVCILSGREHLACAFFVGALNYKQMELYHALPFFCYLLGGCLKRPGLVAKSRRLCGIAAVTLAQFAIIWAPFLFALRDAGHVLRRIFPVNRGIFEDKVANFWCASSVVFKWHTRYSKETLFIVCLLAVLAASLPSCAMLLRRPTGRQLRLSLVVVALAFYLFSFQVHEKSVLLVATPALFMLHEQFELTWWLLFVSTLSLHPLCVKDGTQLAYFALTASYYACLNYIRRMVVVDADTRWHAAKRALLHTVAVSSLCLALLPAALPPPARYPDLHAVANSLFCCANFVALYCAYLRLQFRNYCHAANVVAKVKGL